MALYSKLLKNYGILDPKVPDKIPHDTVDESSPSKSTKSSDTILTHTSALKSDLAKDKNSASGDSLDSEAMGFTKLERSPSSASNGHQPNGPRQALPKGLVATRYASPPNKHHRPDHVENSPTSTNTDISFEDCDLISLDSDDHQRPQPGQKASRQEDKRLHRDIESLKQRLKSTEERAEIAEEKTDRLTKRIEELKSVKPPSIDGGDRDKMTLALAANRLETENSTLKEQLRDAQSHIFGLQPYRQELTAEEIGREYDDLLDGISDWATKLTEKLLQNHAKGVDDLLAGARKKPSEANKLKHVIQVYADLVHGTMYPETDEDIIISIIMRYLNDNIFQKILYGAIASYVEALSFVEGAMQNHVEPKRDLFAIRTWSAEAYNAILSCREFRGARERRKREMTRELGGIFRTLVRDSSADAYYKSIGQQCIEPAMQLYEKMQVSTHHFYFDMNPYITFGSEGAFETSTNFFDEVQDLDCRNILQNRKSFNVAKMDPPPSKRELYLRLLNICTVAPALYLRQVGRKDVIREPQIIRRQQMLVAWGPEEKRSSFIQQGERTLLNHLCSARCEQEKAEAGGWTFRWGNGQQ
ncbi:hypothetical protein C8035_v008680 [Colletotrichum spinosum]|uniref:Uncharacterized protein n=1 Tax=Colletotrichum spinosum TaxID=1347390 RepID=A0A4R8PR84_9PEZI|nr:hypothetical protein C8035_v008680 [Colletotrichum spinosum]